VLFLRRQRLLLWCMPVMVPSATQHVDAARPGGAPASRQQHHQHPYPPLEKPGDEDRRGRGLRRERGVQLLRGVAALCFCCFCVGELLPLPVAELLRMEKTEGAEALGLAGLCCLVVLLAANVGGVGGSLPPGPLTAVTSVSVLNLFPPIFCGVATFWSLQSPNCPAQGIDCGRIGALLDVVALVAGRLARLNLAACLLLASNGESWLFGAASLGYAEAMPLHRVTGWWCAGQAALHALGYMLFYVYTGGRRSLWLNIFPAPFTAAELEVMAYNNFTQWNRSGLINGFGVLSVLASLALVLAALPYFRRHSYEVFQRLHLPFAMVFVLLCALHDLPILMFAAPGLATWYVGRGGSFTTTGGAKVSGCLGYLPRWRRLSATARLLPGTAGPWVELAVSRPSPGLDGRGVEARCVTSTPHIFLY
jgi:hypothetical protein